MGCQRKAARIIGIGRVNLSRKKILVNVSSFFYKPVSFRDGNQKPSSASSFHTQGSSQTTSDNCVRYFIFYRTIYQSSQHLLPSQRSCFLQQQTQKATCFACRTSVIPRSSQQSGGGKKELQRRYWYNPDEEVGK